MNTKKEHTMSYRFDYQDDPDAASEEIYLMELMPRYSQKEC
ncbi:MAG: hypothetical protein QRY74_02660 [Chlamydia sp.]